MKILLFGISCVGKSTVGKILSEKIKYDFYDMDEETSKYCDMSIEEFIEKYKSKTFRDEIREDILYNLIENNESNIVVAMTPMLYSDYINSVITYDDIIAVELQDTVENILERLIFTDEQGRIYPDNDEYKNKYKKHYFNEIKEDIEFYKSSFIEIENKLLINGKKANEVANLIIKKFLINMEI